MADKFSMEKKTKKLNPDVAKFLGRLSQNDTRGRLEYINTKENAQKYWEWEYVSDTGAEEMVLIGFGRIGAHPQQIFYPKYKFSAKLREKLRKGYVQVKRGAK